MLLPSLAGLLRRQGPHTVYGLIRSWRTYSFMPILTYREPAIPNNGDLHKDIKRSSNLRNYSTKMAQCGNDLRARMQS